MFLCVILNININVQVKLLLPYYNGEFPRQNKIFCQKTDNFKTKKLILSKRQPQI